ncbi:hypothetical protein [Salinigranum salinum]|uniref:hypothetical protein n=1 Tax=Salinigranum salinum TaxID=1364937 RepID=UPI0012607C86|nr:hypothetical protein [Salinigranum salinum]
MSDERTGGSPPETERDRDEPLGELVDRFRGRRDREQAVDRDTDVDDERGDTVDDERGDTVDDERGGTAGEATARVDSDDALSGGDPVGETAVDGRGEELFEEMDVAEVDADAVWESVVAGEGDPGLDAGVSDTPGGTQFSAVVELDEGDGSVVQKDDYCESCAFFTAPPEVACEYDGSSIVEVVDTEQFRVRGCPVVTGDVDTDGVALGETDADGIGDTSRTADDGDDAGASDSPDAGDTSDDPDGPDGSDDADSGDSSDDADDSE